MLGKIHVLSDQMKTSNYLQNAFLTVIEGKKMEIISQEVKQKTRRNKEWNRVQSQD